MPTIEEINTELAQIDTELAQLGKTSALPQDATSIDTELAQIDNQLARMDITSDLESKHDIINQVPVWKDVPLEALKNVPSSAVEFGKNIYQAVRHPVQTGKALGTVGLGGIQKLIPGEQPSEQSFDAMVGFFKDRYGGEKNLRRTISQDPVGFLNDISPALSAAGFALSTAGRLSKVSQVAKAGQVASRAAPFTEPVGLAGKAVAGAVSARTPINSIVKTALQFPKKAGLERVDQLANEFIKRGLHLNRKSLAGLDRNIKKVQSEINKQLAKSTRKGVLINTDDIAKSIDDLIANADNAGLGGVDLPLNIRQLQRLKDNFIKANKQALTPKEVQQMKVGLNKAFKPDLQARFAQVKAKANDKLRQATMQELERIHPQLRELNANQGVMIELRKAIESQVLSLEKSPTVPVRGLIAGGVAGTGVAIATGAATAGQAAIGGATFAAISFLVGKLLTNPKIQIALARSLSKANRQLARAGKLHLITQPAFQAGRIERETRTKNPRLANIQSQ